jgi:hypothetical protein
MFFIKSKSQVKNQNGVESYARAVLPCALLNDTWILGLFLASAEASQMGML